MKSNFKPLLAWILLAHVLCLSPGPAYWVERLQPEAEGSLEFNVGGLEPEAER